MKTLLIVGIVVLGMSGQAMSMGHPHNIFAARKQMQSKASAMTHKSTVSASSCWQPVVKLNKNDLSKRLFTALSSVRTVRSY